MSQTTSRRDFLGLGIAGAAGVALRQESSAPQRPRFHLTTTESFDPRAVPAYAGRHERIYAYIDQHVDEHVAHLQRWLRQPSISAQNVGITEMATLLRDDLKAMGFREAKLVPTSGHPGVWGFYDAAHGLQTLLPHKATAKVDSRLPPGLDPDVALDLIRRHLERRGFGDLTIRRLSGYP